MIVKRNDSEIQGNSGSGIRESKGFSLVKESVAEINLSEGKVCPTEMEVDQESAASSEEMESPRSVAKVGRWTAKKIASVHSQVLKIREEDSHLGEDIAEHFSAKDKIAGHPHHLASRVDVVLFSRPILPASPLGGKTTVKNVC
ncbi:uncharacterized protein LOC127804313 [Diospyros lotus]|uniref:uncharacterized protein LOC127804313 n=1 Tax=Diospyros lotus TaxID=55363 RepID=UPI0022599F0D|nr:uncharacterized protein LOC127804313 [Diospyros lotus]